MRARYLLILFFIARAASRNLPAEARVSGHVILEGGTFLCVYSQIFAGGPT